MNGHEHSTPFEAITEMGSGNYNLNIYYLMASSMGSTNMGTWILSIDCGNGEVAKFYPKVGMKMNGSDVVKFKGIDPDMISVHAHDTSANHSHESRTYLLFPEKCELGMSGHNLYLFAAAKESLSSFPALSTGNTLNAGRGHSLAIAQSSIGLSYNGINYSSAELGQGHYVIKNIQGLTSGNAVTFSVNMQINNSYKTTNGLASGNVDSTLTITPSTSTSM